MPTPARTKAPVDQTLARRAATIEQFTQLVLQVPESPEGDVADVLGPILTARTLDDLQAETDLPSSKDLVGVKLRVDSLTRTLSDKPSRTGYYLRCDGARLDTGEVITFTAGGEQSLAVLSQLHVLKLLPAYVQFEVKGTRSGNDALNCKVLGTAGGKTIDV